MKKNLKNNHNKFNINIIIIYNKLYNIFLIIFYKNILSLRI